MHLKTAKWSSTEKRPYASYQSAYQPIHSCETALMKIYSDVLEDLTSESYVIMTLLDFSAAFDIVDHNILIRRLKTEHGVEWIALNWFKSYLSDRSYEVKINDTLSDAQSLALGVPQGSILGPILYSLYVQDIEKISEKYSIKVHIYADEVQLYTACDKNSDLSDLAKCLEEIKEWANRNYLKLNDNKTQLLCVSKKVIVLHYLFILSLWDS